MQFFQILSNPKLKATHWLSMKTTMETEKNEDYNQSLGPVKLGISGHNHSHYLIKLTLNQNKSITLKHLVQYQKII